MNAPDHNLSLLTTTQIAQADQAAIQSGISGIALMEAAGAAVADDVNSRWGRRPVTILSGPGNTGGDRFVDGRHLWDPGWPGRLGLRGVKALLWGSQAPQSTFWGDRK